MKSDVAIRKAERQDVPLLLEFIRGIARYEKMEDEVIFCAYSYSITLLKPKSRQGPKVRKPPKKNKKGVNI